MNQKNQGLTLVEVVIALMLFSIVVVFTLPVFLSANKLNTQTDTRLYAQNVGQESMELWLQEASNTTKESFKPSPEDNLLVGFSLCSSHVCEGKTFPVETKRLFYKYVEPFDVFIQMDYELIVDDEYTNAFTLDVYEGDVLVFQSKDWLIYERD